MMEPNERMSGLPARFKFRELPWICLWLAIIEILCLTMGVIWMRREGVLGGLMFSAISCSVAGFFGIITIRGTSDVVVDDQGISRTFFGMTWQSFQWDSVERLVVRRVMDPSSNFGKTIRAFVLYQKNRRRRLLSGMSFLENAEKMPDLIRFLNHYIARHKIQIESDINGTMSVLSTL